MTEYQNGKARALDHFIQTGETEAWRGRGTVQMHPDS